MMVRLSSIMTISSSSSRGGNAPVVTILLEPMQMTVSPAPRVESIVERTRWSAPGIWISRQIGTNFLESDPQFANTSLGLRSDFGLSS